MKRPVLILDFGSQYTQLIARRVRELGVYSEVKPYSTALKDIISLQPSAIILSGSPASVGKETSPMVDPKLFEMDLAILGVCYGMQLTAHMLGGKVGRGESREFGHAVLELKENCALFEGIGSDNKTTVWMSHGDHVHAMPAGYKLIAASSGAPIAAFMNQKGNIYGIQFHPEVVHTPCGKDLLSNFLFKVAKLEKNWDPGSFITQSIARIREQAGENNVVCGLSGGVDSTVAAILVARALGDRLHCIFVDNGLLRKGEAEGVMQRLSKEAGNNFSLNIKLVDASQRFLSALSGVTDPEKKRKIIGATFIDVFDEEAHRISNVTHLVQGTLYPDVIESVSVRGPSDLIKTHHNVGGLPARMKMKLIEPFRELFKDEVRAIGKELGVDQDIINRQPFPGPGLAVRILGEVTKERCDLLRKADFIFSEEIKAEGLYNELWQSFVVLLPVKSVGVMGDERTYESCVALRAVHSEDGMTADWAYLPHELLRRVSNRIINEVRGINRVVLDISSKPPATIEWE